jgi:hypothetical protein
VESCTGLDGGIISNDADTTIAGCCEGVGGCVLNDLIKKDEDCCVLGDVMTKGEGCCVLGDVARKGEACRVLDDVVTKGEDCRKG